MPPVCSAPQLLMAVLSATSLAQHALNVPTEASGSYQWQMLLPKWVLSEPHFGSVHRLFELGPFLHFLQLEPVHLLVWHAPKATSPSTPVVVLCTTNSKRLLEIYHEWLRLYRVRPHKSLGAHQWICYCQAGFYFNVSTGFC